MKELIVNIIKIILVIAALITMFFNYLHPITISILWITLLIEQHTKQSNK